MRRFATNDHRQIFSCETSRIGSFWYGSPHLRIFHMSAVRIKSNAEWRIWGHRPQKRKQHYESNQSKKKKIITHTHLSEKQTKFFFYQMCHAIKELHNRNITHRDIKPDNILLASNDDDALIKISDFGLSKWCVGRLSKLRTQCGTDDYMAPEIMNLKKGNVYTNKVDVWSMGVLLYQCLSGKLPSVWLDRYRKN